MRLSGNAPLPIVQLPVGEYDFRAEGPGLTAARGRFVRSSDGLSGQSWAAPSAFLNPPGIIHLERGDLRGWVFLGGGVTALVLALSTQESVRKAEDKRKQAWTAYSKAVTDADLTQTRQQLTLAIQEKADDSRLRNLWLGSLAALWVGAGVEAFFLTPEPFISLANPGTYTMTIPRAGGAPAAWRSMFVPGAGQRCLGRNGRADFFLTSTVLLGAGAIGAEGAYLKARRDQASAQEIFDRAETQSELDSARPALEDAADRTGNRNTVRWALIGSAAGIYIWNVCDAYGLGRQSGSRSLSLAAEPTPTGLALGLNWGFR